MPGSPYLEEIPKGLLTWPRLLSRFIPIASILLLTAWYFDILVEAGIGLLIIGTMTALIPRT
jgi:hypothetical protein